MSAVGRFGLTRDRASGYAEGIERTLPTALAAMRAPDGPDRTAGIAALAAEVRAVSVAHSIPRIIERGLVVIAVRIAREVVRRGAVEHGFAPDELEREFTAFSDQLEERLFA